LNFTFQKAPWFVFTFYNGLKVKASLQISPSYISKLSTLTHILHIKPYTFLKLQKTP
jgi:hypothetical protein